MKPGEIEPVRERAARRESHKTWVIDVTNWGQIEFYGNEKEAEQVRRDYCRLKNETARRTEISDIDAIKDIDKLLYYTAELEAENAALKSDKAVAERALELMIDDSYSGDCCPIMELAGEKEFPVRCNQHTQCAPADPDDWQCDKENRGEANACWVELFKDKARAELDAEKPADGGESEG